VRPNPRRNPNPSRELCPMTLNYELDLELVRMNDCAEYLGTRLGQRSHNLYEQTYTS